MEWFLYRRSKDDYALYARDGNFDLACKDHYNNLFQAKIEMNLRGLSVARLCVYTDCFTNLRTNYLVILKKSIP